MYSKCDQTYLTIITIKYILHILEENINTI